MDLNQDKPRIAVHECGHLLMAFITRNVIRSVDLIEDGSGRGGYDHAGLPVPRPLPPGIDLSFIEDALDGEPVDWEPYVASLAAWKSSQPDEAQRYCLLLDRSLYEELQIAFGGQAAVLAVSGDNDLAVRGTGRDRNVINYILKAWPYLTGLRVNPDEVERAAAYTAYNDLDRSRSTLLHLASNLVERGVLSPEEVARLMEEVPLADEPAPNQSAEQPTSGRG